MQGNFPLKINYVSKQKYDSLLLYFLFYFLSATTGYIYIYIFTSLYLKSIGTVYTSNTYMLQDYEKEK